MANERKTEQLIRTILKKAKYTNEEFYIEEQQSDNPKIRELLANASKTGTGNAGYPEFIITKKEPDNNNLIIVIECKADVSKHQSETGENPKDYAVDGAFHYAEHLFSDYNVVCIGASGQTKKELLIDAYLLERNGEEFKKIDLPDKALLKYDDLVQHLSINQQAQAITEDELMKYANKLHNDLRDYANLPEQDKPLLISGILLALQKNSFRKNYMDYEDDELADELYKAIRKQLEDSEIPLYKENNLINVYGFITTRNEFKKPHKKLHENPLRYFIRNIDEKVRPFVEDNHAVDIIGKFYGEFLRYSGGDGKGLGIVLTPRHICELMVELAGVNKDSILLDTCTGTSSILIAGMRKMIEDANGDEDKILEIKRNQLIGIEQQPNMYSLACSNMILRGDGKANMYLGSCFDLTDDIRDELKPNIGIINPPYSLKEPGLSELDFIENLLDTLQPGGTGVVIVPLSVASCVQADKLKIRKQILEKHTLEAVMKMPKDLFGENAKTQTCIMVFTAGIPHNSKKKTWFALWEDDGFINMKHNGRIDKYNKWKKIQEEWINDFINKEEKPGLCVKKCITANDEWVAEEYIETDYNDLKEEHIKLKVFEYNLFKERKSTIIKTIDLYNIINENIFEKRKEPFSNIKTPELKIDEWKEFKISDIFTLENGKGYSTIDAEDNPGENPFICSSFLDNGISCYTSLNNKHKGNSITINKDGSVGYAFYQEKDFSTNKHVIVATPKYEEFNQYMAMFIIPIIELEKFRYSFARAWGLDRMTKTVIKLPVNESGQPDYQFMEDYIKTLPYSKYI